MWRLFSSTNTGFLLINRCREENDGSRVDSGSERKRLRLSSVKPQGKQLRSDTMTVKNDHR